MSLICVISQTNWWIFIKLAQEHSWNMGKIWLDFIEPCLHSYLTNQFVDFDQTCIETPLGHGEEMIRFCWPWPHFQGHTSTLNVKFWPKKFVCTLSLEPNDGFWPNFMYCIIGILKELIRFWWPWPNFQGHHIIMTVKMSLVCTHISFVGFDQTCIETPLGYGEEMIRFCWPWPHFQSHTSTLNVKFDQKSLSASYLLNQMVDFGQILCIVSLGYLKDLIRFWWPWPNFQGHHIIKTVKMSLICVISQTNWWIFIKLAQEHSWNMGKIWLDFIDLELIFKATQALWMSDFDKKILSVPYLLNRIMDSGQTLCIVSLGSLKKLIRFWWHLIFKVI